MDLATGAMGSLLPKLVELLKEEYKLKNSVKEAVESLEKEMNSMHAALRKVAEVPHDQLDEQVKLWAGEVRELSFDVEDVVDKLLVRVDDDSETATKSNKLKRLTEKMAGLFTKGEARHQIAYAIEVINKQVQVVANRRERYNVDNIVAMPAPMSTIDPRLGALYKDVTELVGIAGERDQELMRLLSEGDNGTKNKLKIVSVVGFGGLGKTTLVKTAYDKIKGDFDCTAFVAIGQKANVKKIFMDILVDLGIYESHFTVLDEKQLIDKLQESLKNKRYLIVFDDIWDIQAWVTIRHAFVDHDCGSLVIITTRIFEVAQKAGEVYKMKPLSHEKSKKLLYKRLFDGEDKIPDQLDEVTKSIIQKCDCIPLAIITMASLFFGLPWETWPLVCNSIGFGYAEDPIVKETRRISLYSYYDLPGHLRTCLLHLSIFPEGYMIRKDTLIWKWIAVGFVREEPGVGLFEVGERYFNELINRSLVQPVEVPHSGIIIGCRVNVLVLDMICFLSREESFVTVLDSQGQDTSDLHPARLLAIRNSVVDEGFVQENEMLANQHVRSFSATKCEIQMMPSLAWFQCLRVLALEDCASIGGIYHLEHIRELVQLRYLGLLNTPIYELPEGIGNLKFVQTLDLRQTKIEDLPHGIVLLTQLKCLRAGSRSITVPDGMGKLESLEELQLNDVSSSSNIVQELGKMLMLRDLKLCIKLPNENSKRVLVHSLGNLQRLEILHLDGDLWIEESYWSGFVPSQRLRRVFLGMKFSRLPAWIHHSLLPMLSHLTVDVSAVEEEDLLILGSFGVLLSLSLVGEYERLPAIIGGDAFPRLKYCYTSGMVRFLNGAAPRLESVSFNVRLWDSKDDSFHLEFRSLLDHPLLEEVKVEIFYTEAHVTEVDRVEAALRNVVDIHPNSLILDISKWKSSVSELFDSHDDVNCNEYYDNNEEDNDHEYYYDEE